MHVNTQVLTGHIVVGAVGLFEHVWSCNIVASAVSLVCWNNAGVVGSPKLYADSQLLSPRDIVPVWMMQV